MVPFERLRLARNSIGNKTAEVFRADPPVEAEAPVPKLQLGLAIDLAPETA